MGRSLAAAGAIAIVLGGAAIGYAVTRKARGMTAMQSAAMDRAIEKLDREIGSARTEAATRARTLSTSSVVRNAIVTDPDTVADLVGKELIPEKDEILELGRIDKKTATNVTELLRVPSGAMHIAHKGKVGSYAELVSAQLLITEVVGVLPTQQVDLYMGYLGVTRPLDLGPTIQPLVAVGVTGKLVINEKNVPIGTMPADAPTREMELSAKGATIVVAVPSRHTVMPLWILLGGIVVAAIGLLLVVVGMMDRRGAGESRAFAQQSPGGPMRSTTPGIGGRAPTGQPIAMAATQLSEHGVAAAGTPSLSDPAGSRQIFASNLGAGAMIGRWEVVRRLGSGGMADVYLAQAKGDGGFEKLVAIKVMHGHLARTQRAVDHFLDEARLAARIQHPNVVAIQDLGKIGEDYVIVMEYVEGVDLERLLMSARAGERPIPLAIGLGILCRICDGLDAAHRATSPDGTPLGIVHRDVKSANVLVSRQGSVKVVDFGIAKAAKQVHHTVAGETKGTPSMMAPEQRVGEQVDVRADVYSVAAVGYEIVTGHGVNLDLAALAHLGVEKWPHLPPPSSLRAESPVELDAILLRAMAFERERRPADCAVLEAQCGAVMRSHNLTASDKDIARWVEGELRYLGPAYEGASVGISRSPVV